MCDCTSQFYFAFLLIFHQCLTGIDLCMLTLHDGDHASADPGHDVSQQPLSDPVDLHPANDGQERQRCILGTF